MASKVAFGNVAKFVQGCEIIIGFFSITLDIYGKHSAKRKLLFLY
jgi:hypothetical protein